MTKRDKAKLIKSNLCHYLGYPDNSRYVKVNIMKDNTVQIVVTPLRGNVKMTIEDLLREIVKDESSLL